MYSPGSFQRSNSFYLERKRMGEYLQKRLYFNWKLKVDQEFCRGCRHSRLKELHGQRQVGMKVHYGFGMGIVGCGYNVEYVAERDCFIEHFPNCVPGNTSVPQDGYEYFQKKEHLEEENFYAQKCLESTELYILLFKTRYLLTYSSFRDFLQ